MKQEPQNREKGRTINAHKLSAALEYIERAKMRKEDLRLAAGLTTNQIANMGKGLHISMETLLRICGALDCDISDVIELEREKSSAGEAED